MRVRRVVFIWPKSTHCGTAIVSLVSGYAWDDGSSDSRLFVLHSFSFNTALPRLSLSLLTRFILITFIQNPTERIAAWRLFLQENQTLVLFRSMHRNLTWSSYLRGRFFLSFGWKRVTIDVDFKWEFFQERKRDSFTN